MRAWWRRLWIRQPEVECWRPTQMLRWQVRMRRGVDEKVLQVHWTSNRGGSRWTDIPEVKETQSEKERAVHGEG